MGGFSGNYEEAVLVSDLMSLSAQEEGRLCHRRGRMEEGDTAKAVYEGWKDWQPQGYRLKSDHCLEGGFSSFPSFPFFDTQKPGLAAQLRIFP